MISGTQGTLSSLNGSTLLSGSFSGLDTSALIEAALAAKRQPAVRLENKITENEARSAALSQLQSALGTFSSSLDALRNPPGASGLASNVFEKKAAFLSSSSATPATELLGVTAANSAAPGIYSIEVLQTATAHKIASNTIADADAALGADETLTVGLSGATAEEQADILITGDMTAREVVAAINGQSSATGVRASLLQISGGDYRVVFSAVDTNKQIELVGTSGATTAALGVSADNGASYTNELQAAQPAQLKVDGIATPVERDSNEISDLIQGVTIDIYKAEPGTTITAEIDPDLGAVRETLFSFVDAYNQLRDFVSQQQVVSESGEVGEEAVLFADNIVRSLGMDLGNDLAAMVDELDNGALSTLRDIGIKLDGNNRLTVDESVLDANLVDKLDEVRSVLEFGFQSSSSDIRMISRKESVDVGTFTINIPAGAIDGTVLQVGGVDAFQVTGNTLKGLDGTPYAGLTLATSRDTSDAGAAAEEVTIDTSLGIAERLYQTVDKYINPVDGLVVQEVEQIAAQNEKHRDEITAIDERLAIVQQALIEKYSAMERAISQAESTADQLKAFIESSNDN